MTAPGVSPGSTGTEGWDATLPRRLPRRCRYYWNTAEPCPSLWGSHGCELDHDGPRHTHLAHLGPNPRHMCSCGVRTEHVAHHEPMVLYPWPGTPGRWGTALVVARRWLRSWFERARPRVRAGKGGER